MPYSRTHLATTFPGFGARVNIAPRNRPPRVKAAFSESLAPDQFLPIGPGLPEIQVRWSPATAPNASSMYVDITPYVRSVHIQRGRNDELARFERGVCDIVLDNRARLFDPDYQGQLVNLIENPSFEIDASGAASSTGAPTLTRVAGGNVGAFALEVKATAAIDSYAEFKKINATRFPVSEGLSYTFAADVKRTVGTWTTLVALIQWFDSGGGFLSATQANHTPTSSFARRSVTGAAPAGAVTARCLLGLAVGVAVNDVLVAEALQFEQAAAATAYVDGTLADSRWEGTPHASRSFRGATFYPNVKPLRRIQVRVRWNGVIYDRFTGFTGFELPQRYDDTDATVPLSCFDGFGALALAQMPLAMSRPAELSGARVNAFLDNCGWPAGERSIATGVAELGPFVLGTDMTCLGHLLDVQDAENGAMFIDRSGWFVFQDRHHRNRSEVASRQTFATVGDSGLHYRDVDVRHGGFLWNGAQVTPASGNVQEWLDAAAQTDNYPRVFNRSLPTSTDPDALALAQYVVGRNKTPQRRCYSMKVAGAENPTVNWAPFLGLEISHHVTLRVTPPAQTGTDVFDQDIEGVEETIMPGSYEMAFPMSPHDGTAYWNLGTSQLGVDTVLGY